LLPDRVINTRGNVRIVESTPQDREVYLTHLHNLLTVVEQEAGGKEGWWVIGGIARDAVLQKEDFVVMSPEGTWRDVDILFSQAKKDLAVKVRRENPTPLSIGAVYHNIAEIKPSEATLKFGKINVSVPPQVIEFPTLSAETLFHLYCIGDRPEGKMREKDFLNALDLGRSIAQNPDPKYPESLYAGFHEFSKLKNSTKGGLNNFLYSPLNKVIAINNPRIMPVLEHIWQACGDISLHRPGEKTPTPISSPLTQEAQRAG